RSPRAPPRRCSTSPDPTPTSTEPASNPTLKGSRVCSSRAAERTFIETRLLSHNTRAMNHRPLTQAPSAPSLPASTPPHAKPNSPRAYNAPRGPRQARPLEHHARQAARRQPSAETRPVHPSELSLHLSQYRNTEPARLRRQQRRERDTPPQRKPDPF